MPRSRDKSRNRSTEVEASEASESSVAVATKTTNKENRMSALSPDTIQELLSKTRSRGDYGQVLADFLKSGDAGIEVPLDTGALAGKTAAQAAVGFNNARTAVNKETGQPVHSGGHAVKVIKQVEKDSDGNDVEPGRVYLINTALVQA